MKKQVALALAAALSLSVAGTALAAPANPFVDVPANHWAYDAVKELSRDGVIDGYGDGTFRGDRTLTRYEMAAMIAKISDVDGKHEALIKKLQSEFATELYNLGVRVDALEKNASTIKFSGFARLRYHTNMAIDGGTANKNYQKGSSQIYERVHLNLESDINDNVKFYGTIRGQNESNRSNTAAGNVDNKDSRTGNFFFQRAEFKWTSNNFTASAGRLNPTLGQGLLWDGERADGLLLGYDFGRVNLAAGYLDLGALATAPAGRNGAAGSSVNAFVANLGIEVTDRINFTAAYLDAANPQNSATPLNPDGYAFKQWAVGANAKLGSDFKLIGEYVENSDAPADGDKKGVWGRLQWREIDNKKPGTISAYVDYMKLGNWAIDSSTWGHTLEVAGGNGIGRDGAKGWGLGFKFVPAKNINMDFNIYDLKTYNGNEKYKKSYNITTNFFF